MAFVLSTVNGPLDEVLRATDAPNTLRAAFTLEVTSETATRIIVYDSRMPTGQDWSVTGRGGENEMLDLVIDGWRRDDSPDAMLFPDGLRARLGAEVEARDLGGAWEIGFLPALTARDTAIDVAASERLAGRLWLDPHGKRIVRLEFEADRPFDVEGLGRVTELSQTYVLAQDERYDASFVTAFRLSFEGQRWAVSRGQTIEARLLDVELFFASPDAERQWLASR